MEIQNRLFNFLPSEWEVKMKGNQKLALIAPSPTEGKYLANGARRSLRDAARNIGGMIEIVSKDGNRLAKFGKIRASQSSEVGSDNLPRSEISSYAPSRITSDATYEAVLDFLKGKNLEGFVTTITAMGTDKCLQVNDLQALDRGGGWTGADWVGIDFKTLWRDSFKKGSPNYYGDLVERVERDRVLPNFEYKIRRPSGALAEYSSTYHYVENFLGVPVRVAVSRCGDWRLVRDQHLESDC